MSELLTALRREIDFIQDQARFPKRIRLNPGVVEGTMVSAPITEGEEIDRARVALGLQGQYEVLVHPADWRQLVTEVWLPMIESNMRYAGATVEEIEAMKMRALGNPDGFQVLGIPVVDDTPKVLW